MALVINVTAQNYFRKLFTNKHSYNFLQYTLSANKKRKLDI